MLGEIPRCTMFHGRLPDIMLAQIVAVVLQEVNSLGLDIVTGMLVPLSVSISSFSSYTLPQMLICGDAF